MIKTVVASVLVLTLLVIALFHVYWAFGGQLGEAQAIPHVGERPLFAPGKWVTLAVAFALTLCAIAIAKQMRYPIGFAAFVFFARAIGDFRYIGFFKRVVGTPFAHLDTAFYSPLCLALALGCAYILIAE